MVSDSFKRFVLLVGLACAFVGQVSAHESKDHGQKSVLAVRVTTPPIIDGRLDDEAWRHAPVNSEFTDILDEAPAEDRTEVRLVYDDAYIYVAAVMYQARETINAVRRKYDRLQLRFEDYFQVNLDTFHDHGRAYIFLVSPLGVRWDSRDGLFDRNASWDADWRAETAIEDDRWIVEMAIPIGVMHHNRAPDQTWGINCRRRVSLENEATHWNYTPDARGESSEDIWLMRFESEYTFPWDGRLKLTWEEGSDESHLRTLLFAYEDVRNWDFYIVANDFRFFDDAGVEHEKLEFITKFVYRWKPSRKKP